MAKEQIAEVDSKLAFFKEFSKILHSQMSETDLYIEKVPYRIKSYIWEIEAQLEAVPDIDTKILLLIDKEVSIHDEIQKKSEEEKEYFERYFHLKKKELLKLSSLYRGTSEYLLKNIPNATKLRWVGDYDSDIIELLYSLFEANLLDKGHKKDVVGRFLEFFNIEILWFYNKLGKLKNRKIKNVRFIGRIKDRLSIEPSEIKKIPKKLSKHSKEEQKVYKFRLVEDIDKILVKEKEGEIQWLGSTEELVELIAVLTKCRYVVENFDEYDPRAELASLFGYKLLNPHTSLLVENNNAIYRFTLLDKLTEQFEKYIKTKKEELAANIDHIEKIKKQKRGDWNTKRV